MEDLTNLFIGAVLVGVCLGGYLGYKMGMAKGHAEGFLEGTIFVRGISPAGRKADERA